MKTLLAAVLIVGAFFLGAYLDRASFDPGMNMRMEALLDRAMPDTGPPQVPEAGTYNPNPGSAPQTTWYAAPPASPAEYRASTYQQTAVPPDVDRNGRQCLPDLVARGMSYTSASHICGVTIVPIRRHR